MEQVLTSKSTLTWQRIAVSCIFFVLGIDFSSWASRIPAIKESLHMDDGTLGTVLLCSPLGAIFALPPAGWLVTRFGSRTMTLISAISYSLILPTLGLATQVWQLAVALFFFGAFGEVLNISVNTQAVEVEKRFHKPIMASFHAFFSLGAFAGAAFAGKMIELDFQPLQHFLVITTLGIATALGLYSQLLPQDSQSEHASHPLFAIPKGGLLWLGIIALCCMLGEGAMADWSAEYFKQMLHTQGQWTTSGYVAFNTAMALGRFNGDWITARLGGARMLRLSGWLAAFGLTLSLLLPYVFANILGFALVGFGYATVVPLVYSAAGRSKTMAPGIALAAVSTLGFAGFFLGPPLIGWIAEASDLRMALGFVLVLSLIMVLLSGHARKAH